MTAQPERRTHSLEYRTLVSETARAGVEFCQGDHDAAIESAKLIAASFLPDQPKTAEMFTDVAHLIERRAKTEAGARPR